MPGNQGRRVGKQCCFVVAFGDRGDGPCLHDDGLRCALTVQAGEDRTIGIEPKENRIRSRWCCNVGQRIGADHNHAGVRILPGRFLPRPIRAMLTGAVECSTSECERWAWSA
jgi:hypothetical protein